MGYGFAVSENFIESYCSWLQIATRPGIFKMLTLIYHKEKYICEYETRLFLFLCNIQVLCIHKRRGQSEAAITDLTIASYTRD